MSDSHTKPAGQQPNSSFRDWPAYYDRVAGGEPRKTLVDALKRFEDDGVNLSDCHAIDLGCGEGRDAFEMLSRGMQVVAADPEPQAMSRIREHLDPAHADRLTLVQAGFQDQHWEPEEAVDLLNASYCLPFCTPDDFEPVWQRIVQAITPGGRFAGQLFGDQDDWASLADRSHFTQSQARALFEGFELEFFSVEWSKGNDAFDNPKNWHVYHAVARRLP